MSETSHEEHLDETLREIFMNWDGQFDIDLEWEEVADDGTNYYSVCITHDHFNEISYDFTARVNDARECEWNTNEDIWEEITPTGILMFMWFGSATKVLNQSNWIGDAERELEAIRPAIREFAKTMEERLAANEDKGGWEHCPMTYLTMRILEEVENMRAAATEEDIPLAMRKAANAANFAMMVADNLGREKKAL